MMTDDSLQKRVCVTGADGFIGSHLVDALVSTGSDVTALAQYNSNGSNGWLDDLPPATLEKVTIHRSDIRDPGAMNRLIEGHETVFHLAALIAIPYSYSAPQSYVDVNVTGTLNVLEACRRYGVGRVIQTSTSEVYGTAMSRPISEDHPLQAQSPYAASKIASDMLAQSYARSFELPVIILRPFNTYGPRQSERAVIPTVIRQALDPECENIQIGDTSPKRDFCFVEDTVSAFLAAGQNESLEPGLPYNAGTGRMESIGEMIEIVRRLTGSNKPIETDPARLRPANSEVFELIADAEKFRQATDWSATTNLEVGLATTIDWWRGRLETGNIRRESGFLI
jgi:UDP-glucose 4-epimerase